MIKIVIYGKGNRARKLIKNIKDMEVEVVAVTDTYVTESGEVFEGYPVMKKEDCLTMEFDFVVITPMWHEKEIIPEIGKCSNQMEKVISIGEFYQKFVLGELHEKTLQENELYDFYCNKQHLPINKFFHYFNVYKTYFERFRNTDVVFLEIGVWKGGSMQMWADYFGARATIIGVDIDEECKKFESDNIHIEIGSQDDPLFWEKIKQKYPRIDIILDDGGHTMNQQITTFENMFSHVSEGGIYICEDCCTSYWSNYEGGYKKADSFIEYAKTFIDDINWYAYDFDPKGELKDSEQYINTYNRKNMVGLHYYDCMVVVEKRKVVIPFEYIMENL